MERPLKVFIVAGEASGDLHAAPLMRELKAKAGRPVVFRGIGGGEMRKEGLDCLVDCDSISVIGLWEVLKRIRFFARLLRDMDKELETWKPDLLLTVDYPGFNLRLAAKAKARGIKTIHYICPQVWIWHRNRIWRIAEIIDALITIFPFEPACFEPTKLRPVFAGHPLVDRARETMESPLLPLPWKEGARRVALLPGSRPGEIQKLLPDMLAAAAILDKRIDGEVSFVIPASSSRIRAMIEDVIAGSAAKPQNVAIVDGNAREVLRQAEAAAVTSGTATLEASLMLCPTVLVYRTAYLTYRIGRIVLRKAGAIGLANLITGKRIMPELIQGDLSPESLAEHLTQYLTNDEVRDEALCGLREVNAALGDGNSASRAADVVIKTISQPN